MKRTTPYLNISVVVLAGPDESTGRLDSLSDHIVYGIETGSDQL